MLSTDGARALSGATNDCPPHPKLLAMQVADFRRIVTAEARHFAGLDLERQEAIWRYGMRLRLDAFDWRGHEDRLEAFAAELAAVVDEGIRLRTPPQPSNPQGA